MYLCVTKSRTFFWLYRSIVIKLAALFGEVAERLNAAVLKTAFLTQSGTGVRIPPSPLEHRLPGIYCLLRGKKMLGFLVSLQRQQLAYLDHQDIVAIGLEQAAQIASNIERLEGFIIGESLGPD